MKKLISVILCIMMVAFVFSACGAEKTSIADKQKVQQEQNDKEDVENEKSNKEEENEEVTESADQKDEEEKDNKNTEENSEDNNKEENNQEKVTTYPLTFTDNMGNEITLDEEPNKIISVGPNITETLYAVGAGEKLVGRTKYCDYPAEALEVEEIGTLTDPSIEKIVELKPDIVIGSTHFEEKDLKKLNELDIKVVSIYYEDSFEGTYNLIEDIGLITNNQEKAAEVVSEMKEKVKLVQDKIKGLEKPSLYFVVGYTGEPFTATGDTFIGKLIEAAGAENAASDGTSWIYTIEKLVEKDPDIMICSAGDKDGIKQAEHYKDLTAVKNDKIYEVDPNIFHRQGPRIADALMDLAKIVHPEAFK